MYGGNSMNNIRKITSDLYYVGGNDRKIRLFENILPIHNGVSYNSYLFLDEKTCLMDTADQDISRQFLENVTAALNGRNLDYLVIHHMEPDHCYNIGEILLRYPDVKLVGNMQTFKYLHNFFPSLKTEGKEVLVKDKDTLSLGKHVLRFYLTPLVHWPEVMMSQDETDGLLFTADAFGTFGALNGHLFDDEIDLDKTWLDEARMYYSNIVGKYGPQVQNAFKKLPISTTKMILPLHGPIFRSNLGYAIEKYQKWSTYTPEDKGVMIVYGTMYGDSENAAEVLAGKLADLSIKGIEVFDISNCERDKLVSEAFRLSNLVLIAPTYNASIFPGIDEFIQDLARMNLQKRTFTLIQNGTWAPLSNKLMKDKLSVLKDISFTNTELTIHSALNDEDETILNQIAQEIKESL